MKGIPKPSIGGLKPTTPTPVPGVLSPSNNNSGSPMKVGSQAVVKTPKAKQMGQATDKPSVFFKSLDAPEKSKGIDKLHSFLNKVKSKKRN
jgi:hypothetical protein